MFRDKLENTIKVSSDELAQRVVKIIHGFERRSALSRTMLIKGYGKVCLVGNKAHLNDNKHEKRAPIYYMQAAKAPVRISLIRTFPFVDIL